MVKPPKDLHSATTGARRPSLPAKPSLLAAAAGGKIAGEFISGENGYFLWDLVGISWEIHRKVMGFNGV